MLSKLVLAGMISLFGMVATAEGPHVEPGPQMKLDEVAAEAVDVLLMAKPADLKAYQKAGNTTKAVTRQNWQPGITNYIFTKQHCSLGGITGGQCLGGARLEVTVREKREGSMVTVTATSRVLFIK